MFKVLGFCRRQSNNKELMKRLRPVVYKMCPDLPRLSQISEEKMPATQNARPQHVSWGFSQPPKELQADVVVHFGMPLGTEDGQDLHRKAMDRSEMHYASMVNSKNGCVYWVPVMTPLVFRCLINFDFNGDFLQFFETRLFTNPRYARKVEMLRLRPDRIRVFVEDFQLLIYADITCQVSPKFQLNATKRYTTESYHPHFLFIGQLTICWYSSS